MAMRFFSEWMIQRGLNPSFVIGTPMESSVAFQYGQWRARQKTKPEWVSLVPDAAPQGPQWNTRSGAQAAFFGFNATNKTIPKGSPVNININKFSPNWKSPQTSQTTAFFARRWDRLKSGHFIHVAPSQGEVKFTPGDVLFREMPEPLFKRMILNARWELFWSYATDLPFQATVIKKSHNVVIFRYGVVKTILDTVKKMPDEKTVLLSALAQLDEEIETRCKDQRLDINEIENKYLKIEKMKARAAGTTFINEELTAMRMAIKLAGEILRNGEEEIKKEEN
jgi:hypothetical protein